MLTPTQCGLVEHAFRSLDKKGDGLLDLDDIYRVFDTSHHPRVRNGEMASSAVRDILTHQFAEGARVDGGVSFHVFMRFHERMALEAEEERVADKEAFLTDVIVGVWRLGDLLEPTLIRPAISLDEYPRGVYGTRLMSLVWPDPDSPPGAFVLRVVRDVVQPIFRRGDLPPELRGFFAYPEELAGMKLIDVPVQISLQRWLDFVWEYAEGKHATVPGIISARVDLDNLPEYLRSLVFEPSATKELPSPQLIPTSKMFNPMYRRTSDGYGYGVMEEVKRVHLWKCRTFDGTVCGLIYHGHVGKFTKTHAGGAQSTVATGINL